MNFDLLINHATQLGKQKIAVASAEDMEVLAAVSAAADIGLAEFLLMGNRQEITQLLREGFPGLLEGGTVTIIDCETRESAAEHAVKAVQSKEAGVLMKGNIPTAIFLKAVLNKEYGLRTGKVLSHVAAFEVPRYNRLIFVTDAAMNITPTLDEKAQIVSNAVSVSRSLGMAVPRVAPLAAVETVNPAMQATLDAAALTQMNRRGQLKNCVVDGPLALDNAISALAAEHKGIGGEVAGEADILLVPNIEAGNILYKSLVYFAGAKVGAVIAGAAAPIVLTSRADSAESKLYSLALALSVSK
ncbi:phosphate butyryltransferase [Mesobacillus campisalis]|uniref:Phosphate butyryltransferase n=1 Tax=Mesobacillus campisalis TaxID=1408103 RepID=A0A0M2SK60_9BACI|nr:phosphate butyryltransferase [Mesobacillus campisalis]KKK33252.1 phosphate butyryltransferase [Mesobacillus campisalis]